MMIVNPDNEHELKKFYRDWKSNYPELKKKGKETMQGLKPPSVATMRILFQYATLGHIPGENIVAMLTGALYETFNTSPQEELELIPSTVQYITTYLPSECWGNPEKYSKWINRIKKGKRGVPTEFY